VTGPGEPSPTPGWPSRLDGRVAVVTGASSGLGWRFATVLHAAGAAVVLTARREDRLRRLAAELGPRAAFQPGDLREPGVRAAVVDLAASRFGRLDILVNNAGTGDGGPLHDQPLAAITEVLDLNLVAAVDLCRLAAPLLFAQPGSTVINVASIYGIVGSRAPMAAYNASKGALVAFTRHLAAQWGERGVRVNALAPGFFATDLTGNLSDPAQRAAIRQRTLLGRVPDLSELDGPLLFLASAAASYVTGQVLAVDGGWTAN
jgi:NAD(P)-dependent dehydrogenase (short-subunit alcohol dehydrogenase family)